MQKAVKCKACKAFYLFHNDFNRLNKTGAIADSFNHIRALNLLWNHIFGMETWSWYVQCCYGHHFITTKYENTNGLYRAA